MRIAFIAAAAILASAPALADVKAGVDAWQRGDYRKAVDEWRTPAIGGDADAQFNLGQAYKLGRGVPVDPALAESWFRKAAMQGHAQAEDNYGLALFQYGRKQEAVAWLEKSAARDEPRTQLVLGTMLFNGDGIMRDYPRAYALMTRAAAARPARDGQPATDGLTSARETLQQMDGFITARDRERGTMLAQQMATAGAALPAPTGGSIRSTQPVQTAAVPPSGVSTMTPKPAKSPAGKPVPTKPMQKLAPKPTPTPVAAKLPKPTPTPVAAKVTLPAPKPTPVALKPTPVAVATRGGWKVQLGAFRSRANAETQWTRVRAKLGGATPTYVAAGPITRLQATGFASKTAAQSACRASGVACVVVAP